MIKKLIVVFAVFLPHLVMAATPCLTGNSTCDGKLTFGGRKLPYYRNYPLNKKNTAITQLLIMIHGTNRNADDYFQGIADAAVTAKKEYITLLIAPMFQISGDSSAGANNALYWTENDYWKRGNKSAKSESYQISSFAVIDTVITRILTDGNFPNVNHIVLAGHSAGAQFVQRYAVGSAIPTEYSDEATFRFIVSNPSSYMYLSPHRMNGSDKNSFSTPPVSARTACPNYNTYKYGAVELNSYMGTSTLSIKRKRFKNRQVYYFLGEDDTSRGGSFDGGCEADMQGLNRYQRGRVFKNYVDFLLSDNQHLKVVVRNVGHDNYQMFNSAEGRLLLFFH